MGQQCNLEQALDSVHIKGTSFCQAFLGKVILLSNGMAPGLTIQPWIAEATGMVL
jgi:hypothetical protein